MIHCGATVAVTSAMAVYPKDGGVSLKGLFHPAYLARVVSWFAFVVAIFVDHENGDKRRPTKRRQVQGMLVGTNPSGNRN